MLRDDVGAGSAGDDAWVDGNAAFDVRELRNFFNLARRFENCARAVVEINTGVRGASFNGDRVIPYPFSCRFQFSRQSSSGFHDENAIAVFRFGLRNRA